MQICPMITWQGDSTSDNSQGLKSVGAPDGHQDFTKIALIPWFQILLAFSQFILWAGEHSTPARHRAHPDSVDVSWWFILSTTPTQVGLTTWTDQRRPSNLFRLLEMGIYTARHSLRWVESPQSFSIYWWSLICSTRPTSYWFRRRTCPGWPRYSRCRRWICSTYRRVPTIFGPQSGWLYLLKSSTSGVFLVTIMAERQMVLHFLVGTAELHASRPDHQCHLSKQQFWIRVGLYHIYP